MRKVFIISASICSTGSDRSAGGSPNTARTAAPISGSSVHSSNSLAVSAAYFLSKSKEEHISTISILTPMSLSSIAFGSIRKAWLIFSFNVLCRYCIATRRGSASASISTTFSHSSGSSSRWYCSSNIRHRSAAALT
ncbi:unnamed protein product [Haemonchus placei]|uniref:Secreted protein n=1 Tax=Haemonchus placei TaxID=6290 RepID=A0A0N4WDN6_HAEPC|nr:unnamed protein product [Haemonchus placei]